MAFASATSPSCMTLQSMILRLTQRATCLLHKRKHGYQMLQTESGCWLPDWQELNILYFQP